MIVSVAFTGFYLAFYEKKHTVNYRGADNGAFRPCPKEQHQALKLI